MKLKSLIKKKGKKGQMLFDLMIFMVLTFLLVTGFIIFYFFYHTLVGVTSSIQFPANSPVNWTQVNNQTFVAFDNGLQLLQDVGFAIIFGMFINILLSNYFVKDNPEFFFFYFGITLLCIIVSIFISNTYQTAISNNPMLTVVITSNFNSLNSLMINLPIWVAVLGLIGTLVLLIGSNKDVSGGFGFR